jgi:serine/threonine protein phosphatase 1
MIIEHFERNTSGRDLVIGDIHGCFSRVQAHLDRIGFDPGRDRLFSVGDLVDRGRESNLVLEWLAKPWFHAVCGNHDDMAKRWPSGRMDAGNYADNGGGWNIINPPALQREIADAMSTLPIAIEVETANGLIGIVHADCPFPSWALFSQALTDPTISNRTRQAIIDDAQWSRERITAMDVEEIEGVRAVIVGHTPVKQFTSLGNVFYIDTGAVFPGREFTILDAETLRPVDLKLTLDWAS